MNKKTQLIVLTLILIVVLGGAGILYSRLSAGAETGQLSSTNSPDSSNTTAPDSAAPDSQAPSSEPAEPPAQEGNPAPDEEAPAQEDSDDTQSDIPQAPDFTVVDADGNEVHLSDFLGTPVVLNFWASWCGPCKSEMPDFDDAAARLDGQVQFLLVNMTDGSRETMESAQAYLEETGISTPAYFDTSYSAAIAYGVTSLPTTYFIDAQGGAVARAMGAIDADTLQKGIDMILPPAE